MLYIHTCIILAFDGVHVQQFFNLNITSTDSPIRKAVGVLFEKSLNFICGLQDPHGIPI